jgi:hypothetical protein
MMHRLMTFLGAHLQRSSEAWDRRQWGSSSSGGLVVVSVLWRVYLVIIFAIVIGLGELNMALFRLRSRKPTQAEIDEFGLPTRDQDE